MDIAKRLKQYMEYLGMPSTQFADEAKVSRPTISQILNGRNRKVSNELISKLHAAFPRLNIMWLLFGDGDIELSQNTPTSAPQNIPKAISSPSPSAANDTRETAGKTRTPASVPLQFSDIDEFVAASPLSQRSRAENADQLSAIQHASMPDQDSGRRIKTIMVFYSDNSYEIFKPTI